MIDLEVIKRTVGELREQANRCETATGSNILESVAKWLNGFPDDAELHETVDFLVRQSKR